MGFPVRPGKTATCTCGPLHVRAAVRMLPSWPHLKAAVSAVHTRPDLRDSMLTTAWSRIWHGVGGGAAGMG